VDDYDWVAGPMGSPLMPLADLLMQAGDIGFHVVLSRRVAGMVRAGFEAFFQRLRELGTSGLILSGDPQEGPLLGGQRAEQQPPGRGLLVRRRQKVVHVQTVYATVRPSIYQARDSAG
jgi:S-DNA-T family DNA segregation ATPase FtsK/SpoIIIE